MQRWEYRVISLANGRYTATLNEYGNEGWELVSVVTDARAVPGAERGSGIPMPRAIGRIEEAASKIGSLGGEAADAEVGGPVLLWVLRRPLDDPGY